MTTIERLGVVIIGRNEGDRLRRCLESLKPLWAHCIYVDSGSSDGSVDLVRSLGIRVHSLDQASPFNAARARREGFDSLAAADASMQYVFFVDGDCEVQPGWLPAGVQVLQCEQGVAVVCGRRRERHPQCSVFNRLCDLEWAKPTGDVESCGGDAIMRVSAYQQVGGFDPTVTAGEEPELCQRLRTAGWSIRRTDVEMTLHDANITDIRQWWKRAVRTGYGACDVEERFGVSVFRSLNRSIVLWVVGWPSVSLLASLGLGLLGGWGIGLAGAMLGILVLPLQMGRVALRGIRRGLGLSDAVAYGVLTMLDKWPQWVGRRRCRRDHAIGRFAAVHDYKG